MRNPLRQRGERPRCVRTGRSGWGRVVLLPALRSWVLVGLLVLLGHVAAQPQTPPPAEYVTTWPPGTVAKQASPEAAAPDQPAIVLPPPRRAESEIPAGPACGMPILTDGDKAGGTRSEVGAAPRPSQQVLKEYSQYVDRMIDPENVLDLIVGRPRLLILKEPPKRVQIAESTRRTPAGGGAKADPSALTGRVASFILITDKEISVLGEQIGTTVLNVWFADPKDPKKERILSYLVRVYPDPNHQDNRDREREEALERQRRERERHYKRIEAEINHAFPDSSVCLSVVGLNVLVAGQAKDIAEAAQIIRIVQFNPDRYSAASMSGRATRESDGSTPPPDAASPDQAPTQPGDADTTVTNSTTLIGLTGVTTQATQTRQPQDNRQSSQRGASVINMLRVPGEQQVNLKVVVAEVNRSAIRSIGVNFSITNNQGILTFAQLTGQVAGSVVGATTNVAGSAANNLPASLDGGQILLAINALRNLSYARSLAEPNLTTLNGQTAAFQAGGAFPVPVVTGFTAAGLQGVQYVPFGIELSFTPFITDKDRVRLNVQAQVSTRDLTTVSVSGSQVPSNLNTRAFQTVVELREGQTLAVAGLIQNNLASQADRVPFFGDLPIIGRLGAFDRIQHGDQELIVLVTPELVHPLEPKETPPVPGSDIFEPGDLEFYLFGRLESRRTQDYRSPFRTDINRMLRYRRCEDIYITGPHGHAEGKP